MQTYFYVNIRGRLVTLVILRQDICSGCVGSIGFGVGCDFGICSAQVIKHSEQQDRKFRFMLSITRGSPLFAQLCFVIKI